jgi:hypothetical protein
MAFKSHVTKISDDTNASTVTLVTALVYDAQAQRKNNINCSEQKRAGRERKLERFPTMH